MKTGLLAGLGLGVIVLAASQSAMAGVSIGFNVGLPAPVYIAPAPVYAPPPPVVVGYQPVAVVAPVVVIGWHGGRYWDGHRWWARREWYGRHRW